MTITQNNQYRRAEEIVRKIHGVLGRYEGFRTLHADGRLYRGAFQALPQARSFTRAAHLNGDILPVTVRFSKGGGDPFAPFNSTIGMATRFYLPDGRVTNLVALSQKLFIARSIEQFLALVTAGQPLTPGGPPNLAGVQAALAGHPNSAAVFQMRATAPDPVSFAHTAFHAVHVFRYLNEIDAPTHVRCHWSPVAGERGQPPKTLADQGAGVLFDEFEARLRSGPVDFDLVLEIAEPGDPLDDATALWPDDRRRVTIGRLRLTAPTTEVEIGDPVMNHDPTMLVDGIEATDDPILQIRRGVYELSAALRSGGWRAGQAQGANTDEFHGAPEA
ncbi:MAG: catalase [Caulobacter sp.]|nr:catalase [Caulobacter sp.]